MAVGARALLVVALVAGLNPHPAAQRAAGLYAEVAAAARSGDVRRATDQAERALAITGLQAPLYDLLAEAHFSANELAAAEMYALAAGGAAGWTGMRRDRLVRIVAAAGGTERAESLQTELGDGVRDSQTLLTLADAAIAEHNWVGAGELLLRVVALAPQETAAPYRLGLLLALDNPAHARVYLERAAQDARYADRARAVQAVLAAQGSSAAADARTVLGITLVGISEWPLAERAFDAALAANAAQPRALAYRGYVRERQGRDGWPDLMAARAMSPNDPVVHYLVGLYWRAAGDDAAAADAFLRAYALDPQNPALAAELGVSAQQQGDLAGAEQWLRAAVDSAPDDIRWRRVLAAFYADSGYELTAGALEFIENAHESTPHDVDMAASLGWAYHLRSLDEDAFALLSQAVSRDSGNVRARYYFAVVLESRGDREGALESYRYVWQREGPAGRYGVLARRALERHGEVIDR